MNAFGSVLTKTFVFAYPIAPSLSITCKNGSTTTETDEIKVKVSRDN
jgi:hypothetical protein